MAERASWSLGAALRGVFGAKTIDEDTWDDLESALIRADFGPAVTEEIVAAIKAQVERYRTTDPRDVRLDGGHDLLGDGGAEVGADERGLEVVPGVLVDRLRSEDPAEGRAERP